MRPGREDGLPAVLELWHAEVRAGRQDCVPGEAHMKRLLAGFDWGARSRMVEGSRGIEAAVLVAGRPTPGGTVTQVSVACEQPEVRRELLRWGLDLSKAAGAVAAQVWCGRGHSAMASTTVECPREKKKPTPIGRWPSCSSLRVVLSMAEIWSASKAWRRPKL